MGWRNNIDFDDSFKVINVFETWLGLYRLDSKITNTSKIWLRKLHALPILLYAFYTIQFNSADIIVCETVYYLKKIYLSLMYMFSFYITFVDIFWNRFKHQQLFAMLHRIDENMHTDFRQQITLKSRRNNNILITVASLSNITIVIANIAIGGFSFFLKYFFVYTFSALIDLEMCYFGMLIFHIYKRLKLINEHLEAIFKCCEKDPGDCLISNLRQSPETKLHIDSIINSKRGNFQLYMFFVHLSQVCRCLSSSFDVQILLAFQCSFFSVITFIVEVISMYQNNEKPTSTISNIYLNVYWALRFLPYLLFVCFFSEKLRIAVQLSKQILTKLQLVVRKDQRQEIADIYKFINHNSIGELTACNMFQISASLLLSFVGVVTQYIIAFVQLSNL